MSRLALLLTLLSVAHAESLGARSSVTDCRVVDGHVWAATGGGVVRVDPNGRQTWLSDTPATALSAAPVLVGTAEGWSEGAAQHPTPAPVRAFADHGGALFVGTWGAGVLRDGAPLPFVRAPAKGRAHTRVTALVVHDDVLYVGTAGGGLWRLRGNALVRSPRAAKDAWVTALGSAGSLRVATLSDARLTHDLAWVDGRWLETDDVPGGPWTTLDSAGPVACAGGPKGLTIRRSTWRAVDLGGAPANDIAAVALQGETVWVGYFNAGLAALEAGSWRRIAGVDAKVNVVATQGAAVWAGTARGVYRVEGRTVRRFTRADGLPSLDIHSVLPLRRGGVLVGTGRGAVILGDGPARALGAKQGLPIKAVWAAAELADGRLLLGTSSGLFLGSPGAWRRLSVASGHLPDDWVTALASDGDQAWIGTYNAGVVHLRFADGAPIARPLGGGWVNFNGLTRARGRIYAATMDGLFARDDDASAWAPVVPHRDITQIATAPDGAWIGSRTGLIRRPL